MALRRLTEDQVKHYIKNGGVVCPFCNTNDSIEGGSVEVNNGYASQEVSCNECNAQWQDLYNLAGVCVTLPGPDVQVVDVAEPPAADEPDTYEEDRRKYIEAARRLHQVDGEIEIDDDAKLCGSSDSGENGEYVQAWVWVDADDAGVELPKEEEDAA